MRIKNQSEWQKQLAEFAQDSDPMSDVLPKFLVFWCERAERFMDERHEYWEKTGDGPRELEEPDWFTPIGALRAGLRATEGDLGRIQIGYLGMALVLAAAHWEPAGDPEEFFASMTHIEQNLYADVAAVKLYQLQKSAQEESSGE